MKRSEAKSLESPRYSTRIESHGTREIVPGAEQPTGLPSKILFDLVGFGIIQVLVPRPGIPLLVDLSRVYLAAVNRPCPRIQHSSARGMLGTLSIVSENPNLDFHENDEKPQQQLFSDVS